MSQDLAPKSISPKVIAFDADDTLWELESSFRSAEARFCDVVRQYISDEELGQRLHEVQIRNLNTFGYGAKGFTLAMLETALELTHYQISGKDIERILNFGKDILTYPIDLLPNVEKTLKALKGRFPLIVITKGNLIEQEAKVARSGLEAYFDRIHVVSEKDEATYRRLFAQMGCKPEEVLMVGNSLKSDILPVLAIGGHACHVEPGYEGWVHEQVTDEALANSRPFHSFNDISEFLTLF